MATCPWFGGLRNAARLSRFPPVVMASLCTGAPARQCNGCRQFEPQQSLELSLLLLSCAACWPLLASEKLAHWLSEVCGAALAAAVMV